MSAMPILSSARFDVTTFPQLGVEQSCNACVALTLVCSTKNNNIWRQWKWKSADGIVFLFTSRRQSNLGSTHFFSHSWLFLQTWCQWQGPNKFGEWEKYIVYEREKYCASEEKYSKEIIYPRETVLVCERNTVDDNRAKCSCIFLAAALQPGAMMILQFICPSFGEHFIALMHRWKWVLFQSTATCTDIGKKRDILHSYGHLWGSDESLNW